MEQFCNQLVDWLKNVVVQANANGVVFGMSGGIDSSVLSVICKKAFKDDSLGLIMPCYSNKNDEKDALSEDRKSVV